MKWCKAEDEEGGEGVGRERESSERDEWERELRALV